MSEEVLNNLFELRNLENDKARKYTLYRKIEKYIIDLQQENKQLKEKLDRMVKFRENDIKKIARAIEYIKHAQNYGLGTVRNPYVKGEDLLEILGDKE